MELFKFGEFIMKNKAICITGGAGQIGSNYLTWLSKNTNYDLICIDNLYGGYYENISNIKGLFFYLRDANDDLTDIFERHDIKYVYNMAAFAAEGCSPFMRKFTYTNGLLINANIINFCIKYSAKLIFLSSMSVYGRNDVPFHEYQPLNPIDPYAIGKSASEQDIQVAAEQHQLKWAIIRPHNVIGRNVNMYDRYRNVLGIFMRQILNKNPITIYGDGEQTRAFSWAMDYCPVFLKVAENDYPDPIFNVGGDEYFTLNEVVSLLLDVVGKPDYPVVHLEPRHEVKDAYCDHTKVKTVVGFEPKTNLREMLRQMWEWAITQPNRPVKEFEKFELEDGLYSFWKKEVKVLENVD